MKKALLILAAVCALCASCTKETTNVKSSSIVFDSMTQSGNSLLFEASFVKGTYAYGAGFVYADGEHPICSSDTKNKGTVGLIMTSTLDETNNKARATFTPTQFTPTTKYYVRAYIVDSTPEGEYVYTYSTVEKSFTLE